MTGCPGGAAHFSVTAAGVGPFAYEWRRNGQQGSLAANPSSRTASLTLAGLRGTDAGEYTCVVSNGCGSVTTSPAMLTVCEADMNCDSFIDFFDYDAFVNGFESGSTLADFNGDAFMDFFDYDAFVEAYEAGC